MKPSKITPFDETLLPTTENLHQFVGARLWWRFRGERSPLRRKDILVAVHREHVTEPVVQLHDPNVLGSVFVPLSSIEVVCAQKPTGEKSA